jgi:hypothetical protein
MPDSARILADAYQRARYEYREAIGLRRDELITPALVLDADAAQRNIDRMASELKQLGRAAIRPHYKTHKSLIASAAGVVVVWKSYFSPFTSSGVVFWGLMVFVALVVVTIAALIYMRLSGREQWMAKAQLVFEQSGTSH